MAIPNMEPPVTKPLSAYIPMPDSHSIDQEIPVSEVPRSREAGCQFLSDVENGVSKPEISATEARPKPKHWSDNGHNTDREGSLWSGRSWWRFCSVPNPLSRSASSKSSTLYQDDYDKINPDEVGGFEPGIPRLAAFLNSDESFGIYRSFGPLASRVLLRRMIRLGELEKKQRELDLYDAADPDRCKLYTVETSDEDDSARIKLEQQIYNQLKEFYDLLWIYCKIKTLAKPSKRMHRSLHNWMIENRPLVEGEDDFIHHVKDHVSTMKKSLYASQGQGRMDDFIEKCLARYPGSLIHRFLTGMEKGEKVGLFIYNENRFATLRIMISAIISASLLLLPVFLLFLVSMPRIAMVIIVFGFVVVFTVVLSVMVEGRPQEILVGVAAYTAVLATFLGNMDQRFVPTV